MGPHVPLFYSLSGCCAARPQAGPCLMCCASTTGTCTAGPAAPGTTTTETPSTFTPPSASPPDPRCGRCSPALRGISVFFHRATETLLWSGSIPHVCSPLAPSPWNSGSVWEAYSNFVYSSVYAYTRCRKLVSFMRQIAAGIAHIHSRGLVHRDIACRNILVHGDGSAKVGGPGLGRACTLPLAPSSYPPWPLDWS